MMSIKPGEVALMGSPQHMSPEQLREARNVDGRADIWALVSPCTSFSPSDSHSVEEAVPDHVVFQLYEVDRRAHAGKHVVPLEDLMEHDAVDEAAHARTEKDAG